MFDCVDGIASELVLAKADLFQATIDLKHLSVMDSALLTDTGVSGTIKIDTTQGTIIPVKHTGHADDPINVKFIIT